MLMGKKNTDKKPADGNISRIIGSNSNVYDSWSVLDTEVVLHQFIVDAFGSSFVKKVLHLLSIQVQ